MDDVKPDYFLIAIVYNVIICCCDAYSKVVLANSYSSYAYNISRIPYHCLYTIISESTHLTACCYIPSFPQLLRLHTSIAPNGRKNTTLEKRTTLEKKANGIKFK